MSGEVDELWVWEVSRASRDRPVYAALIGACMAQDVKITVNGRVHDPNDPDDAFMLDLGAALAVKESALTSKRIRRDVAARAAAGPSPRAHPLRLPARVRPAHRRPAPAGARPRDRVDRAPSWPGAYSPERRCTGWRPS